MTYRTAIATFAEGDNFESEVKWQESAMELLDRKDRQEYENGFKECLKFYQSAMPITKSREVDDILRDNFV